MKVVLFCMLNFLSSGMYAGNNTGSSMAREINLDIKHHGSTEAFRLDMRMRNRMALDCFNKIKDSSDLTPRSRQRIEDQIKALEALVNQ